MPGQLIGREGCVYDNIKDKTDILAAQGGALLIKRRDRDGNLVPDQYHIVPVNHVTRLEQLPDTCLSALWMLLREVPEIKPPRSFYWSEGWEAGQRMEHWHLWIRPRGGPGDTSELGLDGLIRRNAELEEEVERLRGLCPPMWLDKPLPDLGTSHLPH